MNNEGGCCLASRLYLLKETHMEEKFEKKGLHKLVEKAQAECVCERIFTLLEENGMTMSELSKETNISISVLSSWKRGKAAPSLVHIARIATYFNVTIDYFMFGTVNESALSKAEAEIVEQCRKMNSKEIAGLLDVVSKIATRSFDGTDAVKLDPRGEAMEAYLDSFVKKS
jgi:transcriptional regulator with XRE-family HTH domain